MKNFYIVLINIAVLFVLFVILDYVAAKSSYNISMKQFKDNISERDEIFAQDFIKNSSFIYNWNLYYFPQKYNTIADNSLRRFAYAGENKKEGGVIVFGCSFAEGAFLNDDETFEYQLMHHTNRTVYNSGYSGFGISPMVWMSKNEDFYKSIAQTGGNKIEYIVYIYISDHIRRMHEERYGANNMKTYIGFKPDKNGSLIEKYPFYLHLNRFYVFRNIYRAIIEPEFMKIENADKNFDLLKLHFKEAKKNFEKHYPNVKFIIIKHPFFDQNYRAYELQTWNELKNEGFFIFDLKEELPEYDFESSELTVPDGHPNAKAWSIVIPELIKKFNL